MGSVARLRLLQADLKTTADAANELPLSTGLIEGREKWRETRTSEIRDEEIIN